MVYENLGNVSQEYKHKQREVHFIALLRNPSLILKLYDMHIKDKPLKKFTIEQSCGHLIFEMEKNIEPCSGLGFAILSEDMLNVARWDKEHPIVIKNQIYGYENNDLTTAKFLDIRNVGAFCIWELGIVNYERNAWKKYLESKKTEDDKEQYLFSTLEGLL